MRASLVLLLAGILVTSTMAAPPLGRRQSGDTGVFDCDGEDVCPTGNITCYKENYCIDTTALSVDSILPACNPETCCGFDTKKGIVVYDPAYVDNHHDADPLNWWLQGGEAHNMYIILRHSQGPSMVTRDSNLNNVITAMNCGSVAPGDGDCPAWVVFPEQQNKKYDAADGLTSAQMNTIKAWTAAGGVLLHAYTAHRASNKKGQDNTFLESVFSFSNIAGTLHFWKWKHTAFGAASTCLGAAPSPLPWNTHARSNPTADIDANGGLVYYEGRYDASKAAVWGIPYGSGFVMGLAFDYVIVNTEWTTILRKALAEGFCPRETPGPGELQE